MIKIEIQVSESVEYKIFEDYYKNPILFNSRDTYNKLIQYTSSISGVCKLFLPEIGIHIKLQQIMIEEILLNKKISELYIFTHSPSIFGKGWHDKIKFI